MRNAPQCTLRDCCDTTSTTENGRGTYGHSTLVVVIKLCRKYSIAYLETKINTFIKLILFVWHCGGCLI